MTDSASPSPSALPKPPPPSRTSQVVALTRAQFVRPSSPDGDLDAQARWCEGMQPLRSSPLRAHLEARTAFMDRQVIDAIGRGITQVVVVGAGYDDRALRFRTPGVRFFELDHPDTQADKGLRLADTDGDASAVTLAPIDFRLGDAADVLAGCGHRLDLPTLFICEGLLVYLGQDTIVSLLSGLRARAIRGSGLAASLVVHPEGVDSDVVLEMANTGRANGTSEPWLTILPATAHLDLVARAGWSVEQCVDDVELVASAAPDRSLLIAARPG
jgi:methyltransferase (TIGR00027 family)